MTLVIGGPVIPPGRVHDLDAVVVGAGGAGLYAALELKQELSAEGHAFITETDTEVVAHLVEKESHGDGLEAAGGEATV